MMMMRCLLVVVLAVVLGVPQLVLQVASAKHPEATGVWFRGPNNMLIDAEAELLREYGTHARINRACKKLARTVRNEHLSSFSNDLGGSSFQIQFIVKRATSIDPAFMDTLRRETGFVEYFPNNAALVVCDANTALRISRRQDVLFVTPVQPAWKSQTYVPLIDYVPSASDRHAIQKLVLQTPRNQFPHVMRHEPAVERALARPVLLSVALVGNFDQPVAASQYAGHAQVQSVRDFATALAANIQSSFNLQVTVVSASSREIVLSVPKSAAAGVMSKLVKLSKVASVMEKPPSRVFNSAGNNIVTTATTTVPNPYAAANLTGASEVIHVADSGLDVFHCFFYDSASQPISSDSMVATNASQRAARRKVVSYWQFIDNAWDFNDHGTHVAGTAAGNANWTAALAASALPSENGLASGAKIAFTDLGCQRTGGCACGKFPNGTFIPCDCGSSTCPADSNAIYTPTELDTGLFPYGPLNDAHISTNSWGGGDSYGSSSRQIDQYVSAVKSHLILFAAGNNGDEQTISEQGLAKNSVTVGASNTGRADFIDIVTNRVNPSLDGGHAFANQILRCAPGDTSAKCQYFLSPNFDACSTTSYCGEGATYGITDCGCVPCDATSCYYLGRSYCSTCLVTRYQNTPEEELAINSLAVFSSTGPTPGDQRIKPDVVAPGYLIASARSYPGSVAGATDVCEISGQYQSLLSIKPHLFATQGTSMSTPLVAGASALIREYLRTYYPNAVGQLTGALPIATPPASLLKAMLINSANPMDGIYCADSRGDNCNTKERLANGHPFKQGFGRIDLRTVLPLANVTTGKTIVLAQEDVANELPTTGASKSFTVTVNVGECLRTTLVWTDPVASASASTQLVNDLDLLVTGTNGTSIAGNSQYFGQVDRNNNVERVIITNAIAGNYVISVTAFRLTSAQNFSLVASTMSASLCVTPSAEGGDRASSSIRSPAPSSMASSLLVALMMTLSAFIAL